jgi:hypothetical protein
MCPIEDDIIIDIIMSSYVMFAKLGSGGAVMVQSMQEWFMRGSSPRGMIGVPENSNIRVKVFEGVFGVGG